MRTDEQLINLIKQEDNDAFEELYQRYEEKVRYWVGGCVLSYTVDYGAVEDVCVDVWTKVWSNPSYKGDSKFSTWLYPIARNTALNYIRDFKKKQIVCVDIGAGNKDEDADTIIDNVATETDGSEATTAKELAQAIFSIMKTSLTDKQYEFYKLDLLGLTGKEMAEICITNENNVFVTLNQARTRMRGAFRRKQNAYYNSEELVLCMEYLLELLFPAIHEGKEGSEND